jgi:hypothetical protein
MKNQTVPPSTDQEFVDITWQIVYSGRTFFKFKISESFTGFMYYNMTETKEFQQEVQHNTEIIRLCIILTCVVLVLIRLVEGLRGNQVRKGSHPRRIFFISMLG